MEHQNWGLEYDGVTAVEVKTTMDGVMISARDNDATDTFRVGIMRGELAWLIEKLTAAKALHDAVLAERLARLGANP